MKKIYALVLILFLINTIGKAQTVEGYNSTDRKIEVLACSSIELTPNDFYLSFVLKEYKNNGKIITIKESLADIEKIMLELKCDPADLTLGNIYGYVDSKKDGSPFFQEKIKYILRLNKLECIEQFMVRVNKFALESVNIDEINVKFPDTVIREMQRKAFEDARAKANLFLAIFNESCGKVLDIYEINGVTTKPSSNGEVYTKSSIMMSEGIQYSKTVSSSSKMIKFEYVAKVVFAIK
jgi:hypothetical protein